MIHEAKPNWKCVLVSTKIDTKKLHILVKFDSFVYYLFIFGNL